MRRDEWPCLTDLYTLEKQDHLQGASYMLQFLWRDLTSNYDVIGPYYSSEGPLNTQTITGCLLLTITAFQDIGFKVRVIVCDGASSNLSLIKETMHFQGAVQSMQQNGGTLSTSIKPWFLDPGDPTGHSKIYWVICPSHQMKSMISALHASRSDGSKCFEHEGVSFGWSHVAAMYAREMQRAEQGLMRVVPKLRLSYIERDAWTRLNVTPSRIMQQEQVLQELRDYSDQEVVDHKQVSKTLEYLNACNEIFEQGLLTKTPVRQQDDLALKNIVKGMTFFRTWQEHIHNHPLPKAQAKESKKRFLAWQTWDLLRICTDGFLQFSEWFFQAHPEYFISPIRINGSSVESLFSQYKASTAGKLTSINYRTAQRSVYTTATLEKLHPSAVGYRDEKLYIKTPTGQC